MCPLRGQSLESRLAAQPRVSQAVGTPRVTSKVEALVRAWIEQESLSEWAFVRRVPSTHAWKTVDYLRALEPSRRPSLCAAFLTNAMFLFDAERDPALHAAKANNPEFSALLEAGAQAFDWQYLDVRSLRAILGDQTGKRPTPALAKTPPEILERARAIRPTSATEIRKAVKAAFQSKYGARPRKTDGGDWQYEGTHHGRRFVVSIDYGGWYQLRYSVEYDDSRHALRPHRLTYEQVVGAGHGHWDALTADNLEASVGLLCELVDRLVEIPDALDHHAG